MTKVTNRRLADATGLTISAASYLRNNKRRPSPGTMLRVKSWTGWSVEDQVVSRERGTYGTDLVAVLAAIPA